MKHDLNVVIGVFAYKRAKHLAILLDSLALNRSSLDIPLRIYIDGPKGDDDIQLTSQVLHEASRPRGFSSVEIIPRPTNLGLYASITLGVSELLQEFEAAIIFEDDLLLSAYCIDYFLKALTIYQRDDLVASIHAWTPSIRSKLPDTFFLRGAECWGWATWRSKWSLFRHDAANMVEEMKNQNLIDEFNYFGGYDYFQMLQDRANNINNSWAICWRASCFLANKLTLHPSTTLVENIGCDYSGEHCGPDPLLQSKLSDWKPNVEPVVVVEDSLAYRAYCNYFKSFITSSPVMVRLKKKLKQLLSLFDIIRPFQVN